MNSNKFMMAGATSESGRGHHEKGKNPSDIEEINELENQSQPAKRYDLIKEEHDRQEAEARKNSRTKIKFRSDETKRTHQYDLLPGGYLKRDPDDVRAVLKAMAGGSDTTGMKIFADQ